MTTRCQVCGRGKRIRADGMIAHHHFRGLICMGTGALPYDQDDSALRAAHDHWSAISSRYTAEIVRHAQLRLNEPLSAGFYNLATRASSEAARLSGRLYRRTYCKRSLAA